MSYNKFLDAAGTFGEVRDEWINKKRYKELIAFILENWDSGNCDEFSRPLSHHLIETKEANLFKQLWKGIIRNRLEKLWGRFKLLKTKYPNFTLEDIKKVDLTRFNEFSPKESIQRETAYKRLFTLAGIKEFMQGLEALGETEEIEVQKKLYRSVENLEKPKPQPTTDRRKIDERLFWQLIGESRTKSSDQFQFLDNLKISLEAFNPNELRNFDKILRTKINELNSWDLWALAYIVKRGCSDDGFDYFKAWVVSKGEQAFNDIKKLEADRLPALFNEDPQLEEFYYLAQQVYESKTSDLMKPVRVKSEKLTGTRWDEDSLNLQFPVLCKIFDYPNTIVE